MGWFVGWLDGPPRQWDTAFPLFLVCLVSLPALRTYLHIGLVGYDAMFSGGAVFGFNWMVRKPPTSLRWEYNIPTPIINRNRIPTKTMNLVVQPTQSSMRGGGNMGNQMRLACCIEH